MNIKINNTVNFLVKYNRYCRVDQTTLQFYFLYERRM